MSVAGWLDALHSKLPKGFRLIWQALESHANSQRRWCITDAALAAELHISTKTVQRGVARLAADEVIAVQRRKRRATVYTMLKSYPRAKRGGGLNGQNVHSTREMTGQNVHSTALATPDLSGQNVHSSGELTGQNVHTIESNKNPTEKKEIAVAPVNRRALTDTQFDTFWESYPRKEAKAAARKALAALLKAGTPFEEVVAGLKRHTFTADREFIPHASTWLRGRRWEDEPKPKQRGVWDWADHLFDNPGPASRSDDDWDGTTIDGEVSSAPTYTH